MADEDDYMEDDDMDMEDSVSDLEGEDGEDDEDAEDMNEEAAAPAPAPAEEDAAIARRRAIQAIMRDNTLSDQEKRMRIQNLMSGGRTEVAPPPTPVLPQPETNNCVHYERNCNIVAPCKLKIAATERKDRWGSLFHNPFADARLFFLLTQSKAATLSMAAEFATTSSAHPVILP